MAYSFDGETKLITLDSDLLSIPHCYSAWKQWVMTNAWAPQAFNPVGGQPIDLSVGTFIPFYAFLINGWRIRPREANHTLTVKNGILLVDGGGDPFVNTIGTFVIRINYQQPVQAIGVLPGGGSRSRMVNL